MRSKSTISKKLRSLRPRLGHTLLISFLLHALILSLKFDLPGLGMPGELFGNGEKQLSAIALNLKITAMTQQITAEPAVLSPEPDSQLATPAPAVLPESAMTASLAIAALVVPGPTVPVPLPDPAPGSTPLQARRVVRRRNSTETKEADNSAELPAVRQLATDPQPVSRVADSSGTVKASSEPAASPAEISTSTTQLSTSESDFIVPPAPSASAPVTEDVQRAEAMRQEAQRAEAAAQAAAQASARQEAMQREAQRQEALRQEAQRAEAAVQAATRAAAQA
ncbi:MAG: hypothetical protein WCJ76_08855, partial [Comamonadaceae bacterium]